MHWKDINVFFIQRSEPDFAEIHKWINSLPDCENHRVPADVKDMEAVPLCAGKRCYMSFEPGANPNVTKVRRDLQVFFDNILSSGHGCYDAETDVLTDRGWVSWPEVRSTDSLATRRKDGVIEYHHPVKLLKDQPYSGRMYRVDSAGVDLLVTPNHNMFVVQTTTKLGRQRRDADYSLIAAEKLGHVSHAYIKTGIWNPDSYKQIPDVVLELLGFAIGDGYYSHGAQVHFHLKRERKIAWLISAASRAGWKLDTRDNDKYVLQLPSGYVELFSSIYGEDRQKQIPQELLTTCNSQALYSLYTGLMQSDGCCTSTSMSFDSTSRRLINQFQQLCLHIGLAANISCTRTERNSSFGDLPLIRAQVIRRELKPEVNKWDGQVGKTAWVEQWEGLVYCAEVPNNTLYVRRNGKAVWCGNSVLEHSTWTVAIEGVTRVFTGEMNRHRAGVAVSEGSMRFILQRLDEAGDTQGIGLWLPNSLRDNYLDVDLLLERKRKTRESFERIVNFIENEYKSLCKLWSVETLPMSEKKKVTSMLRRILPMGCSTGGVWTMNVRAMRHIIATRTSPHAEEEIAHVFGLIATKLVAEYPRLLGDFEQNDKGVWTPKYPKV